MPGTIEGLAIFLAAIVPGYLAVSLWSRTKTFERPRTDLQTILQAITVSVVIQLFVSPLTVWLLLPHLQELAKYPLNVLAWALVAVILVPVISGLVLGRLADEFLSPSFHLTPESLKRNVNDAPGRITRGMAGRLLKLRPNHLAKLADIRGWLLDVVPPVAPSPWDAFVKLKVPDGRFLRITFDDNTQVAGSYYGRSFAITSPQTPGIFLVEEWLLDQNGDLVDPVRGSAGLLIPSSARIKHVRVLEPKSYATKKGE